MTDVRIVQLSIGDLLGSTHYMTCAEMGAYMRLMLWHYQRGAHGIPGDDPSLARHCHLNMAAWLRIKNTVLEKFQRDPDASNLKHRRVLCELEKIAQVSAQNRDKALKRHGHDDAPALPLQYNGNANLTPTQGVKTPLPPGDNSTGSGAGSFDKSGLGEVGAFNVMVFLNDDAIEKVKQKAPGWDIYRLAEVYNAGINGGTRARPRSPRRAFPSWCALYTRGRRPG